MKTLRITAELLAQALHLPLDTTIHDVRFVPEFNWFELRVEHPELMGEGIVGVTFQCEYHHCPSDKSVWRNITPRWA